MDTVAVGLTGVRATRTHRAVRPWLDRYVDALLSCVGFGWYEWRAMGLRKGEGCGAVGREC
jgi:hypothetical protein